MFRSSEHGYVPATYAMEGGPQVEWCGNCLARPYVALVGYVAHHFVIEKLAEGRLRLAKMIEGVADVGYK